MASWDGPAAIRQSPPIDLSVPYDADWVKDKVILITGGASGFGAAFVRHWAKHGAIVIAGDINTAKGLEVVASVRQDCGHDRVHFVHCDVTSWQSQVAFFKQAVALSPHGGIDCVVANAGIAGHDPLQLPDSSISDMESPPEPKFAVIDVNLTGVLYTTHLAYHYLPRNPGSGPSSITSNPETRTRDRHLLLLGSIASLAPIVVQPLYGAAKHAVLGLFRSLRSTAFERDGIRVNLICPYFIDTPIVTPGARVMLAGGAMGKVEDVVDAATRFVASSNILGRALVVGPKVKLREVPTGPSTCTWELDVKNDGDEQDHGVKRYETAIWECYADDWEEVDAFDRNIVRVLNAVQAARGWTGWAIDIAKVMLGPIPVVGRLVQQ
ncbi:hypothetical protein BDV96DRAFT_494839 [Lophiotrema nucula]|uniref:Uncharacterized protein n=1 Tax=Lophiotrema nucula TaxID=690887 RepID=A0A6A5Z577_9PLEO|nr:hypothetical protein BDV96DRAFT_494839 [Lophiotrema nucula]